MSNIAERLPPISEDAHCATQWHGACRYHHYQATMPKILSKRNHGNLIAFLNNFTCIYCHENHPGEMPSTESKDYNYTCQCTAVYPFHFYRGTLSWYMRRSFLYNGKEWMTRYEPAENRTYFWFMTKDFQVKDEHEFDGYITHDTFSKLIPFT